MRAGRAKLREMRCGRHQEAAPGAPVALEVLRDVVVKATRLQAE